MNGAGVPAPAVGHLFVDFHDDGFRPFAYRLQMGCVGAETEVSAGIHGSHLNHHDIGRTVQIHIVAGQLRITDRAIVGDALGNGLSLNTAHMPRIPAEMLRRVFHFKNFRHFQQNTAADFNIMQFGHTRSQRFVQSVRRAGTPSPVQPVS